MKTIKIAVNGALGRMGRRIIALAMEAGDFEITDALEDRGCDAVGRPLAEWVPSAPADLLVASKLRGLPRVLIDFSSPKATLARLREAQGTRIGFVIGTTGFTDAERRRIKTASRARPILLASNMSVGVNVLFKLAELTASALGEDYDAEIVEIHHRRKKDAPSGTALSLARAVAGGKGLDPKRALIYGRSGLVGERPRGEIAIHALRGGDIVGDHTLTFATTGERIELVHRAQSRDTFARGALRAARFIVRKRTGMYDFQDVIGLRSFTPPSPRS